MSFARSCIRHSVGIILVPLLLALSSPDALSDPYFPPPGSQWERRGATEAGFDPQRLADAVAFAVANEVAWERDMRKQIEKDVAAEPYPAILGEANERGGPAGMIVPTATSLPNGATLSESI